MLEEKESCSVVVPVFNEEENIMPLSRKLKEVFQENDLPFEIIFVDDASSDGTLAILREVSREFPSVRYISLSRNFGHQTAIRTGLAFARNRCVVTMDGDFQHPPEFIPIMLDLWRKGYDIVNARRRYSPDTGYFKKLTSRLFRKLNNALAEVELEDGVADFRLMDRKVVDIINGMTEENLFIRGIVAWLGFHSLSVDYEQPERVHGVSKYTLKKMFSLALSGITSFSVKPLRLALAFGCAFSGLAFLYGVYAIYVYFMGRAISGWASLLVSTLFLGGIQLTCLGIIGEYLAKVHMQVKNRPAFVIKEFSCDHGQDRKTS
ncbi:MAG: glycosyltransferase family 2 protein [Synergistaceae bacterium]|jgi:dolichol-phosphate mannosyltransferase|nr:glycosyltransferase family 2 protein [Synergistaceae bacterium]